MGAPDILARLHAVGVNLSRRGDKLIATPKASVTPKIVDLIREHKPELLTALPDSAAEAELRRLVLLVTSHLDYFKAEREQAEALENALAHPDLALPFWRGKAKQLGLE